MSKKITEEVPHSDLLLGAGFTTYLKVQKATDEELLAIEGFGPASLEKVRAATAEGADAAEANGTEEATGEEIQAHKCSNPACGYEITASPCPYCGAA